MVAVEKRKSLVEKNQVLRDRRLCHWVSWYRPSRRLQLLRSQRRMTCTARLQIFGTTHVTKQCHHPADQTLILNDTVRRDNYISTYKTCFSFSFSKLYSSVFLCTRNTLLFVPWGRKGKAYLFCPHIYLQYCTKCGPGSSVGIATD